jgi:hypothetical protein
VTKPVLQSSSTVASDEALAKAKVQEILDA